MTAAPPRRTAITTPIRVNVASAPGDLSVIANPSRSAYVLVLRLMPVATAVEGRDPLVPALDGNIPHLGSCVECRRDGDYHLLVTFKAALSTRPWQIAPSRTSSSEFREELDGWGAGAVVVGTAGLAAYLIAHGKARDALVLAVIPFAIWLLAHPTITIVFLGLSLPVITSVSGASEYSTGYKYAASDLFLALAGAGILVEWSIARPVPIMRALRPVARPVAQYGAFMILLLGIHLGLHDALKTGQRYELYVMPLIVGAYAAMTRTHLRLLAAYVVASTLLAAVFPFHDFGMQHNPVGQMIGNAILLLLGVRELKRLGACLFVLGPGLVLTQSRGAVLATALGAVAIFAVQRLGTRPLTKRVAPVVLVGLGAFFLAPVSVQQRLTTLSAGDQTAAQYSILIRQVYASDAHRIIRAHPWTGVGVGNYGSANAAGFAQDPHNVLLLEEAEGGYLFGASFLVLVGGALFALRRMRDIDVGPAAIGVLLATVAHGFVDVYWVRGTPVLGWLLVGMACGGAERARRSRAAP